MTMWSAMSLRMRSISRISSPGKMVGAGALNPVLAMLAEPALLDAAAGTAATAAGAEFMD